MSRTELHRIAVWSVLSAAAFAAAAAAEPLIVEVDNPRFDREGQLYRQYCGACHGPRGGGDGVVAPFMDPRPIELTSIKENFGGSFPRYLVTFAVDGRDTVRAHGESFMPVWGEVFSEEFLSDPNAAAKARGLVIQIVDYIESIQK